MHRFIETLRIEWPKLLLEFVVLVVGVSLSFAVDQWRRDREDRAYEKRALGLIREGLVKDSVQATRMIDVIKRFRRAHEGLLASTPTSDSVDVWMDLMQSYIGFERSDWAYQELRLGGNTRVLRDNRVFAEVTQAYQSDYKRLAEWDEVTKSVVLDRIIPYVDDHSPSVPITTVGSTISGLSAAYAVLRTQDRFRNLQRSAMAYRDAQIYSAEQVVVTVRSLLSRIDSVQAAR
jgi:hypothetical protein